MRSKMNKRITILTICLAAAVWAVAGKVYYVSPSGSDSNSGTIDAPFATLNAAHSRVSAGDTVYFRGGTYMIDPTQVMLPSATTGTGVYTYVFDLAKSGNATAGRIVYAGYPGERPVFDFSQIQPLSRISGFYLHGSYLHLKNFEITGIKATLHGHYQCECISARNGSFCIVENIAMHDNMAIGYYATRGQHNLVLNCDAYNNFDDYSAFKNDSLYNVYKETGKVPSKSISETLGGNCDGFGFHASREADSCNVFRGCRAWWNSDDGFDCINSKTAVVWDNCWAFYNGYKPGTSSAVGDGNGFKAGGYGMSTPCTGTPAEGYGIPANVVTHCIAFYNKSNGFYANHHLGGCLWLNNTAMWNRKNYDMVNRKEANQIGTAVDVNGYGHILRHNVSYAPMDGTNKEHRHFADIDSARCTLDGNVVAQTADFLNATRLSYTKLAQIALCNPREADGSLPYLSFLRVAASSPLYEANQGAIFENLDFIYGNVEDDDVECIVHNTKITKNEGQRYTIMGTPVTELQEGGVYIRRGEKVFVRP